MPYSMEGNSQMVSACTNEFRCNRHSARTPGMAANGDLLSDLRLLMCVE